MTTDVGSSRMRDGFARPVKIAVASRAGHRCSNPVCRRPTSGPREDPRKSVNIGVAAHITAAAPGGPRYDPELSTDGRSSIANAIWLCQNCAKLVDNDEERFTEALLRQWKEDADKVALKLLTQPDLLCDLSVMPGLLQFLESLVIFIEQPRQDHPSIEQFLVWLPEQDTVNLTPELERIVDSLRANPTSGNTILGALSKWLAAGITLGLVSSTARISDQLESLYKVLVEGEQSNKEKHRLRVSARLLEIASRNLTRSGMHRRLGASFGSLSTGAFTFRWRMGDSSPEMMLVDLVGGVLEDRMSVILGHDGSIRLRAYDPFGQEAVISSKPCSPSSVLTIAVVWDDCTLSLWIGGKQIGSEALGNRFESPWVLLLAGIDIEGDLSADTCVQGYKVDGLVGWNLGKNGLGAGGRLGDIAIFDQALPPETITDLASASDQEVQRLKREAGGC